MSTVAVLKEILADLLGDPGLARTLPDTASLRTDVGLDSLQLLQFMHEIETSLGIEIDWERIEAAHALYEKLGLEDRDDRKCDAQLGVGDTGDEQRPDEHDPVNRIRRRHQRRVQRRRDLRDHFEADEDG